MSTQPNKALHPAPDNVPIVPGNSYTKNIQPPAPEP